MRNTDTAPSRLGVLFVICVVFISIVAYFAIQEMSRVDSRVWIRQSRAIRNLEPGRIGDVFRVAKSAVFLTPGSAEYHPYAGAAYHPLLTPPCSGEIHRDARHADVVAAYCVDHLYDHEAFLRSGAVEVDMSRALQGSVGLAAYLALHARNATHRDAGLRVYELFRERRGDLFYQPPVSWFVSSIYPLVDWCTSLFSLPAFTLPLI